MPVDETAAFPELLLHTPPGAALVSVIVELTQTVDGPLMEPALGSGFMVTTYVAEAVAHAVVAV
jgi:hypothetical protein